MKRMTVLALLTLFTASCGDDNGTGPGEPAANADVASITVTGSGTLNALGGSLELAAEAFDEDGQPLTGVQFTWTSSDANVATVDDGTVVAAGNGTAAISARANGFSDAAAITVAQEVTALVFVEAPGNSSLDDSLDLTVEMHDGNGNVATNFDGTVALTIGTNPLDTGALTGTTMLPADSGTAAFRVALDTPGAGYTLVATADGVMQATAAFNVTRPAVYFGAFQGSNAFMISLTADSTLDSIQVGSGPTGMAITPDGLYALSSARSNDAVHVIETTSNAVIDTIPVGDNPQLLGMSPDGSVAYVANSSAGTISVIQTASFAVSESIDVGGFPIDLAFSPDGAMAYVAINTGQVVVIETATHTPVDTVVAAIGMVGVAVSGDGQTVYASAGVGVVVIDAATGTVLDTITVGSNPQLMATSLDGMSVFVTNNGSGTVSRISTVTNTVTATITVGGAPLGITTGPDGLIFVSSGATVSIINPANDLVIDTMTIPGATLSDMAVMPHPVP